MSLPRKSHRCFKTPGLAITTRSDATVGGNPIRKAGAIWESHMDAMAIRRWAI